MTNLGSILKSKDNWRIDAFESWCWRSLLSPLDCKVIKPVNSKENQPQIFIGRTGAEAEAPILWPPNEKSWHIGKDPDAGQDWGQEEKSATEDEIVGWHHWLDGHTFEQTPGDSGGQRSLVCCSPWGHRADVTYWLHNNSNPPSQYYMDEFHYPNNPCSASCLSIFFNLLLPYPFVNNKLFTPTSFNFTKCYIVGILPYVASSYWPLSHSNMHLKFLHISSQLDNSFIFRAESHIFICMYHSLFTCSSTEGQCACFQVWGIKNKAAVNSKIKTWGWLWLRSSVPYCKIQVQIEKCRKKTLGYSGRT